MIFTVANVESISEIVFNENTDEMLIIYSNPHPGNQRRNLQVRFGADAFKELIQAVRSMPLNDLPASILPGADPASST
ncbi:hypothetical protein D9M71_506250 [compost metagenome]